MPPTPPLARLRRRYHERLCAELLSSRDGGELNIADGSQAASVELAREMLVSMKMKPWGGNPSAQQLGSKFATITCDFLEKAFRLLHHVRPGAWTFSTAPGETGISHFAQYAHLAMLKRLLDERPDLKASWGGDYIITPDIVVARRPVSDDELNRAGLGLDADSAIASRSPTRAQNRSVVPLILHASISMKWTMRSDRSQNTRTEALNLIRNRKGRAPHIAVVTFEPLPSRIASIAMGTGDVDCTYHVALPELIVGAKRTGRTDHLEMLMMLVDGDRLRDISDLVLDLAS
ncbi:MAG: NgoMIV family type II restriction endonuclease [Phycisphaerae bacterium]|nr:NgoMIV family type II restriction endonuclease [Phycisphaerae bacterium]